MLQFACWGIIPLSSWATAVDGQTVTSAEEVGRAYISAYSLADWNRMATFMGDSIALVDRTNPDPKFVAITQGRGAVLAMLRTFGASGGVEALDFDFPIVFASNSVVVFAGRVNTLSRPRGGADAYRWRSDQVIALTIHDGKVVRHEDFADYAHPRVERVPAGSDSSGASMPRETTLASLAFLLGEWRVISTYRSPDRSVTQAGGHVTGRVAVGGQAIELGGVHDDPSAPSGARFHDSHTWMLHPKTGKLTGITINSLGNRKFNDGAFVDGDLLVTSRGEMFNGGAFIDRQRMHRTSADRVEVTREVSTDDGRTWRDGGYSAVWERVR